MASVTFDSPGFSREKRHPRTLSTRSFPRLSPGLQRALRIAGAVFTAAVLLEFGFRIVELFDGGSFAASERIAAAKFSPGREFGGRAANNQGYWDDEFAADPPQPGTLRVAIVGGESTLGGDARTNFAARIEQIVPGLEIDHFGLPELAPADWTTQLTSDILPRRPRVGLVCVSADDVVAGPDSADWLESRALRWAGGFFGGAPARGDNRSAPDVDFESFVRRRAPAVAACRTDDEPALARRWRDAQLALSRFVHQCRLHDIGVGLVLTPGEYQLAPNLAASYCRNLGLDSGRIDVDLPQRRWTAYADKLEVASVDLLPAFRGAGCAVFEPASVRWTEQGQTVAAETIGRWLSGAYAETLASR
jgi:hypothetical protein